MRKSVWNCLSISVKEMKAQYCFETFYRNRTFAFDRFIGRDRFIITLQLSTEVGDRWVEFLSIENECFPGGKVVVNQLAKIEPTYCFYGGARWWFICPMINNGKACNRRSAIFYFPPGGRPEFGCRHCHELRYPDAGKSSGLVW